MAKEKISPIILTDEETGKKYTLEFNRESVRFAESRGFNIDKLSAAPMTMIPLLFWCAFRMHHRHLSREDADKILYDKLGGLPEGMLTRLGELYNLPFSSLIADEDEAEGKKANPPKMTVEF